MKSLGLILLLGLSGCLSCEPLLELRHCVPDQCTPSGDAVAVAWTDADAAAWPEVDALLRVTADGAHEHMDWHDEAAFWNHYGVAGDEPELIIAHDGERYRLRILTCA